MSYKNRTYVAFDGDKDIHYYRLMMAWKQNDHTNFNFYDAHDITQSRDSSSEETIKRSLQVRMNESKVFVLLVGESTKYLYKFVKWEIEQALKRDLPIIVVNLNGTRQIDVDRCPSILKDHKALHVSFNAAILQKALEEWPSSYERIKSDSSSGPFYYNENTYKSLGI
ncbi:MAG: TIR domain-containing protein [Bacteriovoracaceae bacterium]|nr:TIR domain-containing protein [Bacteriovoracaceae bacterium]